MAGFLDRYAILQQNNWNGRKVYSAKERESGQVVHLIADTGRFGLDPYYHPSLPVLSHAAAEGEVRWLAGPAPGGDTLEDLWRRGALSGREVVVLLLGVLDGLASLSRLEPPLVPGYLDPAIIKRDRSGRWLLDYLSLAHSPEARASGGAPIGVYPMGTLLFWLGTGQVVRRTRSQVVKLEADVPSHLQFMIIKAMGRSYPSLAELRVDLERANSGRVFEAIRPHATPGNKQPVAQPATPVPAEEAADAEQEETPLEAGNGGEPRNWALPTRPEDGFRRFVVPPPPPPAKQRAVRWAAIGATAGVALAAIGLVLFVWGRHEPSRLPDLAVSSGQVGPELPPQGQRGSPVPEGVAAPVAVTGPLPVLAEELIGHPVLVVLNGEDLGWIYSWKMSYENLVSLEAMNQILGERLRWIMVSGGALRIFDETGRGFVTYDYDTLDNRIWLILTLALQQDLGIQLDDTTPGVFRITHVR